MYVLIYCNGQGEFKQTETRNEGNEMMQTYESSLKSSWTGGNALLLCCYSYCITAAHCRQSTNFSNGPRSCSAILKRP